MNSVQKITLLLADDHPSTLMGIRTLLSEADDLEIIGEAQNGFQVKELVAKLRPNVLLLDLKMPGPRPAEIEEWIRENHPETITLVLTAHDRDRYLAAMMDAGAAGYLNKESTAKQLTNAIRRAVQGALIFDEEQYARAKRWKEEVGEKLSGLTNREIEILELLANGRDNQEIAKWLGISVKTAAYHVGHILSKLQVKSRQEAAVWAAKNLSDDLE
jgi:DNA-binding NarL/FixJ family response regulator